MILSASTARTVDHFTVDTNFKTNINFARIAITRQIFVSRTPMTGISKGNGAVRLDVRLC